MDKTCTSCGQQKPATSEFFVPNKECRGGLAGTCRACRSAYHRKWKGDRREILSERRRKQYAERYREKHIALERARAERAPFRVQSERLWSGILDRSKKRGLAVSPDLSRPYIEAWLRRQPNCECCGVAFWIGAKNGLKHDTSPSIDRRRPEVGYVTGNISLICWRCNNIKRDYEAADLRRVAAWLDKFNQGE